MPRAVAAFFLVLTVAGAAVAQTLTRAGHGEPASLDPHKAGSRTEQALALDLFEGLLAFDADGTPVPGLADSWAISPDGLRYVFNLRQGLVWSDGAPLTAEQVAASFRRLLDPRTAAPAAAQMYVLRNARAVNTGKMPPAALGVTAAAGTVALELEAPAPYLPSLLASAFAVAVPPMAHAEPEAWTRPGAMVGNGAFVLSEREPRGLVALARNERYRDAANVKLARVVYRPMPVDAAAALRAGEVDMVMEFPAADTERLAAELKDEARLAPALLTYYLALNTRDPKLADRRVRRALSLALDRDTLAARAARGGAQPALSLVPPATANYTPPALDLDAAPYQDRLGAARRLLAEAGHGPDAPLRLVYSHAASPDLRRIALAVAAMWKRAGVEASVAGAEGPAHLADLREGRFEVAFLAWLADVNDAANFLDLLQSSGGGFNHARYDNPVYDGLLRQAARAGAPAERAKLLREAEALMLTDQPVIPLYFGATRNLVSRRVVGWRANPTDVHLSRYLAVKD